MPAFGSTSFSNRYGKPKKAAGFTPFSFPTSPPPGTYDPALDAGVSAAKRGYGDLQQDNERDTQRAQSEYAIQRAQAERNKTRSLADVLRDRAREGTDYSTNVTGLRRRYEQLGSVHGEQAAMSGQTRGGALAAALEARTANQGLEQTGLDTRHTRYGEDSAQSEKRISEDYDTPDTGIFAALEKGYQYGQDDRVTQGARAGRELGFFEQDTGAQRFAQAAGIGYSPPERPRNEYSDAKGPYRLVIKGNKRYRQRPNGTLEPAGTRR